MWSGYIHQFNGSPLHRLKEGDHGNIWGRVEIVLGKTSGYIVNMEEKGIKAPSASYAMVRDERASASQRYRFPHFRVLLWPICQVTEKLLVWKEAQNKRRLFNRSRVLGKMLCPWAMWPNRSDGAWSVCGWSGCCRERLAALTGEWQLRPLGCECLIQPSCVTSLMSRFPHPGKLG